MVITGTVIDSVTQKPIDLVTVKLSSTTGKPYGSAVTAKDGRFQLIITDHQNYILSRTSVGYIPKTIQVYASTAINSLNFGQISLVQGQQTLVKVKADRQIITHKLTVLYIMCKMTRKAQPSIC
jgi:hypothetical protein